jgi:hypothetical protein
VERVTRSTKAGFSIASGQLSERRVTIGRLSNLRGGSYRAVEPMTYDWLGPGEGWRGLGMWPAPPVIGQLSGSMPEMPRFLTAALHREEDWYIA